MKDFKESDHPRDGDGRFAEKASYKDGQDKFKVSEDFFDEDKEKYEENFFEEMPKENLTNSSRSDTIIFNNSNPKEFVKGIVSAKESIPQADRWRVDIHKEEDYLKDKLFVTKGGSCVAVEPEGNIISVCKNAQSKERGSELLKHAIQNGGDKLDAFGKKLYNFYTKNGFEAVSWTPFNEEYAPDGWNKNRDEKEPVIFYKYNKNISEIKSYNDFISNTKSSSDYDIAKKIRDGGIKT